MVVVSCVSSFADLKSNMDRFIDHIANQTSRNNKYLKSNMDRFIASETTVTGIVELLFKIQYG